MKPRAEQRARGFTLVEALVVIAILAAVGLVAVRSSRGLLDRAHFEATQRLLADTRDALVGKDGFVADLGRLPDFDADPAEPLRELLTRLPGVTASDLRTSLADDDIYLPAGWRGPYLQLAPGADRVLDGWARPLVVDQANGDLRLRSLGADGLVGGTGFDTDIEVQIVDTTNGVDMVHGSIAISVTVTSAPQGDMTNLKLRAVIYIPDAVGSGLATVENSTPLPGTQFPVNTTIPLNGVCVGKRVVRAYLTDGGGMVGLSLPVPVELRPGVQRVDLEIP